MKIGTTPTHNFTLPFSTELVGAIEITYSQCGKVILQKNENECTLDGRVISVTLSQADTFEFASGANVEIQLRVKDKSGNVHASDIMCVSCKKFLSDEVLV